MSTAIAQRSFIRHLENFSHHIYAAYSDKNATEVRLVLEYLRRYGLKVYDPAVERTPGKRIFHKWLENGIHKSRVTLLFWSKEFRQDELCLYQSENAVLRTSLTKGRHIVICVAINNCKIPALYKQFDCVYAWKWRENPPEALDNVLQSVLAHLQRARMTYNLGHRASFLVRKKAGGLCQHNSKKSTNSVMKAMHVLLNFRKIKTILENCVLCCQNHGCAYRCAGENIKEFYAHVSSCKFAHVQCSNIKCRQTILRGHSVKHKLMCRYKKLKCPNEKCTEQLSPRQLKKHQDSCPHRTKNCPNHKVGCEEIFEFKDIGDHLKVCKYERIECDLCETKIIRMSLEDHKNHRCPHAPAPCPHCQSNIKRLKLESHMQECSIQVTCDNLGCGAKMVRGLLQRHKLNCPWEAYKCSYKGCNHTAPKQDLRKHSAECRYKPQRCEDCGNDIAVKDIDWHRKFCDQILECKACGLSVPASIKPTHDEWICCKQTLRTFCRDCHAMFSHSQLENHRNNCQPVNIQEVVKMASGGRRVSKPIGIDRPSRPTQHERFPMTPTEQRLDAYTYPSRSSPIDSGFHSLSSTNSRPTTPLTKVEMSALKVAIETIPEADEAGNTFQSSQQQNRKPRSSSEGTQEIEPIDWGYCNEMTPKIRPHSRNILKAIDDLFYSHKMK